MPRPVVPSNLKNLKSVKCNTTSTTEDELWSLLSNNYNSFENCKQYYIDACSHKLALFIDGNPYEGHDFKQKESLNRKFKDCKITTIIDEKESKITDYMNFIYLKNDLIVCNKSFNWENSKPEALVMISNLDYFFMQIDSYIKDITNYENSRYMSARKQFEKNNRVYYELQNERKVHIEFHGNYSEADKWIRHHSTDEKTINEYIENANKILNSCKYCIETTKYLERKKQEEIIEENTPRVVVEENPVIVTDKEYKCDDCNHICYNIYQHKFHLTSKEHMHKLNMKKWYCEHCKVQSRTQIEFENHEATKKHGILSGDVIVVKPNFKCETCDYDFNCKTAYEHHISTKSHKLKVGEMEKPTFKCEICDYETTTSSLLLQHNGTQKHKNMMPKNE